MAKAWATAVVQPQLLLLSSPHSLRCAGRVGRFILQGSTISPCFWQYTQEAARCLVHRDQFDVRYATALHLARFQDARHTSEDAG